MVIGEAVPLRAATQEQLQALPHGTAYLTFLLHSDTVTIQERSLHFRNVLTAGKGQRGFSENTIQISSIYYELPSVQLRSRYLNSTSPRSAS